MRIAGLFRPVRRWFFERKRANLSMYQASFARRDAEVGNLPIEFFLEMANCCNIQCVMCPRSSGSLPVMSRQLIETIIPFLGTALGLNAFGFGEPLMNPSMDFLLRAAKRRVVYCDFFTNGVLLDGKRARLYCRVGVDRITLSINSATAETYEAIHRGARFAHLEENLRSLCEEKKRYGRRKPELMINMIAMTSNFEELPRIIEWGAGWGLTHIELKPLVTYPDMPETYDLKKIYCAGTDEPILRKAEEIALSRGVIANFDIYRSMAAGPGVAVSAERYASSCFFPYRTFYVDAGGLVKPCCFYGDRGPPMGDLNSQELLDIWQGEGYSELRRELASGRLPDGCRECHRCELRPMVDGAERWLVSL